MLEAYDRMIGLELADVAVDCCITKAPCGGEKAGRSPVDRGKQGIKRSMAVDADGIPLGVVAAPANRHDSPLLAPPWTHWRRSGLPERQASTSTAATTPASPARCWRPWLIGEISERASLPRLGPRTVGRGADQLLEQRPQEVRLVHRAARGGSSTSGSLSPNVIIIVGRLIRKAWTRYRWEGRPARRP